MRQQFQVIRFAIAIAFFALAARLSSVRADDPARASELEKQYEELADEYQRAQQRFYRRYHQARNEEARTQLRAKEYPDPKEFAEKFMAIARKDPSSQAAFQAAQWVLANDPGRSFQPELVALLEKYHLDSERLGAVFPSLSYPNAEPLLRLAIRKSPHHAVQGQATLSLARFLVRQSANVRTLQDDPEGVAARRLRAFYGASEAAALARLKPNEMDTEAERLFETVLRSYSDIPGPYGKLSEAAEHELFEIRHLAVGKIAPSISGESVDGRRLALNSYRGKVVVLVFWGTWCGPCRAMIPHERSLVDRLAGEPFALLGISSDHDRSELKQAMIKEKMTWPCWWDGGSTHGPIATAWNVHSWPKVYVLDRQGKIRFKDVREHALDEAVDQLLAEAKHRR